MGETGAPKPPPFSLGDVEGGVAHQLRTKSKIQGETLGPPFNCPSMPQFPLLSNDFNHPLLWGRAALIGRGDVWVKDSVQPGHYLIKKKHTIIYAKSKTEHAAVREVFWRLRTFAALAEDPGIFPSMHVVTPPHL